MKVASVVKKRREKSVLRSCAVEVVLGARIQLDAVRSGCMSHRGSYLPDYYLANSCFDL